MPTKRKFQDVDVSDSEFEPSEAQIICSEFLDTIQDLDFETIFDLCSRRVVDSTSHTTKHIEKESPLARFFNHEDEALQTVLHETLNPERALQLETIDVANHMIKHCNILILKLFNKMAPEQKPHYRPQVNGQGLQTTWYIPRTDIPGAFSEQPDILPLTGSPPCHHGLPPGAVIFYPNYLRSVQAPLPLAPPPERYWCSPGMGFPIDYTARSLPIAASLFCLTQTWLAPPPQSQPVAQPPSQTVNGGFNAITPQAPIPPAATYYPVSADFMNDHRPYFSGPYHGPALSEIKAKHKVAISKEKPQDMKPSDNNPDRFYQVQELDGSWTRRNRRTIDEHLGSIRWYQRPDGTWFVVRLKDE